MEKVIKFLKENSIMAIATSLNDKPRSSTMEYVMIGDSIFFATSPDSTKVKNLEGNNRLSISVHNMPRFVTIDGHIVEPTKEDVAEYTKLLSKRHPQFVELMEKGLMLPLKYFKVVIDAACYSDYSDGKNLTEMITAV